MTAATCDRAEVGTAGAEGDTHSRHASHSPQALHVVWVDCGVDEWVIWWPYINKERGEAAGDEEEEGGEPHKVNSRGHPALYTQVRMNVDEAARALTLGRQYLAQREFERAIRLLERSVALCPTPEASDARA